MDETRDYHTNQIVRKEKQIPYDITYLRNLKYDKNECIYESETDSQTLRTACSGQERIDWVSGISRCYVQNRYFSLYDSLEKTLMLGETGGRRRRG